MDLIPGLNAILPPKLDDNVAEDEAKAARDRHEVRAKSRNGKRAKRTEAHSAAAHYLKMKILKSNRGQINWAGVWNSRIGLAIMEEYFPDGNDSTLRLHCRDLDQTKAEEYLSEHGNPEAWPALARYMTWRVNSNILKLHHLFC